MHIRTSIVGAACACVAVVGLASPSAAQEANVGPIGGPISLIAPGGTPTPAVEADAIGWRVGGFRLFPSLELGAAYDSNVYRTQLDPKGSPYFVEQPGFLLQSEWSRNELDVYGSISDFEYVPQWPSDQTDYNIGTDGRLDIARGIDLLGGASYSVLHQEFGNPDLPGNAIKPTEFGYSQGEAAFEYHPYQFGFKIGGTFDRYDFRPTDINTLPFLNHEVNNDDENYDSYTVYAKASYEFQPGYAIFLQANHINNDYDLPFDLNHLARTNSGYSINAGMDVLVTHLITGEVFVGYLDEQYKAPLSDISGLNFGSNLTWSPTPIWSFTLTASRSLQSTIVDLASAEDDQGVRVAADYKFRPNIMLEGYVGYTNSDFAPSVPALREDYIYFGANLNYAIKQGVAVQLRYDYQDRSASLFGDAFNSNVVSLNMNLYL